MVKCVKESCVTFCLLCSSTQFFPSDPRTWNLPMKERDGNTLWHLRSHAVSSHQPPGFLIIRDLVTRCNIAGNSRWLTKNKRQKIGTMATFRQQALGWFALVHFLFVLVLASQGIVSAAGVETSVSTSKCMWNQSNTKIHNHTMYCMYLNHACFLRPHLLVCYYV